MICNKCGSPGAVLHFPGGYLCSGGCKSLPFEVASAAQPPKAGLHQRRVRPTRERRPKTELTPRSLGSTKSGSSGGFTYLIVSRYGNKQRGCECSKLTEALSVVEWEISHGAIKVTVNVDYQFKPLDAPPSGERAGRA